LLLLGLLAHPAAAYAAPGDPAPGSPSGAIYELPFEQGRSDAAPKGGAGAAGGEGSHYRSENNFGSSSQVPGSPAAGDAGTADANGVDGGPNDAGAGGPNSNSGGGGGGGAASEGSTANAGIEVADTGNTSPAATFALLAAIGAVAVGIGTLTARGNRFRSR
jgi:hypothetical protein